MNRETFIIGSREFAASKIPAFQANTILLRLQKVILPALGAAKGKDMLGMELKEVAVVLSENLDEKVMDSIIIPMFKYAQVASVTDRQKIDSETAINMVFVDADGLADFYELIYFVLKYNYANFFNSLVNRFGNKDGEASS